MDITKVLCDELKIKYNYGENVIKLIDEGNTIPFIARYRKELTGSMDDQLLRAFSQRLTYLRSLEERKEDILKSIDSQEKLTKELEEKIKIAPTLAKLEDLYRPYKPKRKTRASVAREKGLEPLASFLLLQDKNSLDPYVQGEQYVKDDLDLDSVILGAQDIVAEIISDSATIRDYLRKEFWKIGELSCKGDPSTDTVYSTYYDFSQEIKALPPHRILAINRGEKEGFLKVSLSLPNEIPLKIIEEEYIKGESPCKKLLLEAIEDSYTRLLLPSLEREVRNSLTESASKSAIRVFSENLKNLLLQPPVSGKVTLGLDPAYRTGCKIAIVDETGLPLHTDVIYPTPPQNRVEEAEKKVLEYIKKYNVDIIAIGNGTASRESELFVSNTIKKYTEKNLSYIIVNEAGASVYSASKLAAKEFPNHDVSLRSAVSIARRLQDPLAELVKIDPKSIGVGQYQHDMPKSQLESALGGVVESCVNSVGVDLNTASPSLLSYVAGITGGTADNIVLFREQKGKFKTRKELLKVSKLGPKAFEQCAGFLRIHGGNDILDNTGIHPESYDAANKLLQICSYTTNDIKEGNITEIRDRVNKLGLSNIAKELDLGIETLEDIIVEMQRPGRDPREELEKPILRSDVLEMKDLKAGMELMGTVRNVIDFGAFIDIGVHQDGLVHISQICNRYIKHPLEVLSVGDIVKVQVMDVDANKGKISLTMKNLDN